MLLNVVDIQAILLLRLLVVQKLSVYCYDWLRPPYEQHDAVGCCMYMLEVPVDSGPGWTLNELD